MWVDVVQREPFHLVQIRGGSSTSACHTLESALKDLILGGHRGQ